MSQEICFINLDYTINKYLFLFLEKPFGVCSKFVFIHIAIFMVDNAK